MDRKGPKRMKRSSVALFGAVAALLFAGPSARADFVQWRYNWTPSTLKVVSDTTPTSFVQLSGEPIPHPRPVGLGLGILRPSDRVNPPPGDSDIQMVGIKVTPDLLRGNPNVYRAPGPGLGLGILYPRQPENRGGR